MDLLKKRLLLTHHDDNLSCPALKASKTYHAGVWAGRATANWHLKFSQKNPLAFEHRQNCAATGMVNGHWKCWTVTIAVLKTRRKNGETTLKTEALAVLKPVNFLFTDVIGHSNNSTIRKLARHDKEVAKMWSAWPKRSPSKLNTVYLAEKIPFRSFPFYKVLRDFSCLMFSLRNCSLETLYHERQLCRHRLKLLKHLRENAKCYRIYPAFFWPRKLWPGSICTEEVPEFLFLDSSHHADSTTTMANWVHIIIHRHQMLLKTLLLWSVRTYT